MRDLSLLEDVLAHIALHPEQHDQSAWLLDDPDSPCGTTCCAAGHALLLSGKYDLVLDPTGELHNTGGLTNDTTCGTRHVFVDRTTRAPVDFCGELEAVATKLLNLEHEQAEFLFHRAQTRTDVFALGKHILNNPDDTDLLNLRDALEEHPAP